MTDVIGGFIYGYVAGSVYIALFSAMRGVENPLSFICFRRRPAKREDRK